MKSTKEKIKNAALTLFNQNGMVNVRLQHIADEAGLSVGNMAYHFKNKAVLVETIHSELIGEQKELMSKMNVVPLFEYVETHFQSIFRLQKNYSFFFTDMLEVFRAYEEIAHKHRELIAWQKEQYRMMVEFNRNRGALAVAQSETMLPLLVDQLWMNCYMYFTHQHIHQSVASEERFLRGIWCIFLPLMTERGFEEYKQMKFLQALTDNRPLTL